MATVYLAHDLKHERQVAVKALHPELSASLGADRFLREIRIAARLTHPHILPLHDSGEAGEFLFYVMPFVEGESVRDLLKREKQLPVDLALRITCEVADALKYAHAHGVVHRDIKPENILLEDGHAVVADFGIARAVGAAGGDRLTETGLAVGTPVYMSPEQAAGDSQVDGRSDLYSLACVLYEMLAGQPPFTGPTVESIIRQQLTAEVPNITRIRPTVPAAVVSAMARALAKTPADRFSTTQQFADALMATPETVPTSSVPPAAPDSAHQDSSAPVSGSRRRWLIPLSLLVLLAVGAALAFSRTARVVWAKSRAIPSIQRHLSAGEWEAAYRLAARLDSIIPNDSAVNAMRAVFADTMRIEGAPAGARVYRRSYAGNPADWQYLGAVPIPHVVLPRLPLVSQFRYEAPGFATAFDIDAANPGGTRGGSVIRFSLPPKGTVPPGMVFVRGGDVVTGIPQLPVTSTPVADFFLDRFEVTNREYQVFVDSGGYRRRELWVHPFQLEGRNLSWGEGIKRLVDQTGRPGPATWEAGRYPGDRADHPVAGVSWYEAAAYARFRGKRLPNVFQWSRAARFDAAGAIVLASNIERAREGTAPVGSFAGMSGAGAMDMAGNVREWCFNESKSARGHYILGGGWNDATYTFLESAIHAPFDRSVTNGIRLVQAVLPARGGDEEADRPVEPVFRDYNKERPVPDQTFQFYRRQFAYDPSPLEPRVERRDSTAKWIREQVSYNAGYAGERLKTNVLLPVGGRPPYQAVVFFPGSGPLRVRSSETLLGAGLFDFLVQDGRAIIYPVFKGTYERGDGTRISDPDPSNRYKEHVIQWQREVSRTLDYLGTRADMDTTKLAYLGFSWGGRLGGIILAIEPRFHAAVLTVAGLNFRPAQPEVDDINYLRHVRTPVLMLNGRYDNTFPLETAARPMFELLGTAPDHKRHVVADGVHYVPRYTLIRETLAWLDRYLGPVGR